MINKKNVLGKVPAELGIKDAIHTAIVSVRAAKSIQPGEKCIMNEHNEATPNSNGIGVADPFRKSLITTGQPFWLLLNQDEIPNVSHVWEHPTVSFDKPTREIAYNTLLKEEADNFGVTYEQLLEAALYVADNYRPALYPASGTKRLEEDFQEAIDKFERWDFWSEWAYEAQYEFENQGSACCPEYNYPDCDLFRLE